MADEDGGCCSSFWPQIYIGGFAFQFLVMGRNTHVINYIKKHCVEYFCKVSKVSHDSVSSIMFHTSRISKYIIFNVPHIPTYPISTILCNKCHVPHFMHPTSAGWHSMIYQMAQYISLILYLIAYS